MGENETTTMVLLTVKVAVSFAAYPDFSLWVTYPLAIFACGVLVGGVVVGGGAWTAILRWAPVVWVGRISYSLYLWHLPVYVAMDYSAWVQEHRFWSGCIKLTLSVALAAASFHLVERPLLRRFAHKDSTAVKGEIQRPPRPPSRGVPGAAPAAPGDTALSW